MSVTSETFALCRPNPLIDDPAINITFDDVLAMTNAEFLAYVDRMRTAIRKIWDEEGIPPATGWSEADITNEFERLVGFPTHTMWERDELTGNRVIHNTHVLGNAVNAWNLARMLKVRINYTEKDDGRSIYDFFAKDELFKRYIPYARRHILRDSFYFFATTVRKGDRLPHRPDCVAKSPVDYCRDFALHERPYDTHELLIEPKKLDTKYTGYAEHLKDAPFLILEYDMLMSLVKDGILPKISLRLINPTKHLNREHAFHVRMYKKGQKLFPAMFKSFRVSMCQYAVNFPPLIAKLVYEEFLKHCADAKDTLIIWDPSAGWAGRLLGALATNIQDTSRGAFVPVRYLGTDPNPDFYRDGTSVYDSIAAFYNNVRESQSLFGDVNTHQVWQSGSEVIQHHPEFQQYKGKLDLVFTSPPYFNREAYSEDPNQSYKKFNTYASWRDGFLRPTLQTAYDWLASNRYLIWNIADLKVGKKYLPLEQDSCTIAKSLGFEFVETIYMTLRGMPGANRVDENGQLTAKNMCRVNGRYYKCEPLFVFRKP